VSQVRILPGPRSLVASKHPVPVAAAEQPCPVRHSVRTVECSKDVKRAKSQSALIGRVVAGGKDANVQGSQGAPKSEGQAGGVPRPQSSSEPRPRGTVYLAWDSERNLYWGYWDQSPDGPPRPLEQCPLSSDIRTVVQWGRARARRVIIRPESDPAQYYWAGVGHPEGEFAELPRLRSV
jgi:hypothetical protein